MASTTTHKKPRGPAIILSSVLPWPVALSNSQQEQQAYYQATTVGMTMVASEPEGDVGAAAGKGSKRKGRDMERALARGDLGALGKEVRT